MRVHVDRELCQGHSRCVQIAPELFVADEVGYAKEVGSGRVVLPLRDTARLAAGNCPERAIIISDDG